MSLLPSLSPYADRLSKKYENYPQSRYVNIFLLRTTRSETIFRTEGSGEPMCRELVDDGQTVTDRVVITRRKQVAVERRTGREILRQHGLLFPRPESKELLCALNTGDPCGQCVDCWLYGYAVGSGGAQKSRVITEDAYSILPSGEIIDTRTFNAIFDNGTMRNPDNGDRSQALGESEYVRPGAHFLDIEVLKDVTEAELCYVLGNILRSTRYGATSSRIGRIDNTLLGVAFSDQELDSTLCWLRATVAALGEGTHPLGDARVASAATTTMNALGKHALGKVSWADAVALQKDLQAAWENPRPWLAALTESYPKPATEEKPKKGKK